MRALYSRFGRGMHVCLLIAAKDGALTAHCVHCWHTCILLKLASSPRVGRGAAMGRAMINQAVNEP
eukprot:1156734-Pelagomonas_calceolata.AAC.2